MGDVRIPSTGVPRDWIASANSQWADWIDQAADDAGVPRQFMYNLFWQETANQSGLRNLDPNPQNAAGLGQLTPAIASYYGVNRMNPQEAIWAATLFARDIAYNEPGTPGNAIDYWTHQPTPRRDAPDFGAAAGGYISGPSGYYWMTQGAPYGGFGTESRDYVIDVTQGVVPPWQLNPVFIDRYRDLIPGGGYPPGDPQGISYPPLGQGEVSYPPIDPRPRPRPVDTIFQQESINQTDLGGGPALGPNADFLENPDVDPYALQGTTLGEAFPGANFGFVPQARMAGAPEWDPESGQWGQFNTGGVPEGGYGPWWNQGSLLPADWGRQGGEVGATASPNDPGMFDYATYMRGMNIPSSGQLTDWFGNPINVRGPQVITDTGLWQGNPDLPVGMGNRMGDVADMSTYGHTPFDYSAYFNALRANTAFNPGNLASGFDMNAYNQAAGIGGGSGGSGGGGGSSFFDATPAPTIDYQHYFQTTGINPPADFSYLDDEFAYGNNPGFGVEPDIQPGLTQAAETKGSGYVNPVPTTIAGPNESFGNVAVGNTIPYTPPVPLPAPTPQYYNSGIGPGGVAIAPGYNSTQIMTYNIGPGGVPLALGY